MKVIKFGGSSIADTNKLKDEIEDIKNIRAVK